MKRKLMISAMAIPLSAPSVLLAQRGGQGRGGQQGQGAPPRIEQRGGEPQGQRGGRTGEQTGSADRQEKRIHATDKQRDQYKTCTDSANRIREQSRDLSQLTNGSNFDMNQVREQRDQLREHTRILMEQHDRFMKSLSAEQRSGMKNEIQDMEKARDRLQDRLQEMDQQLNQDGFDREQIRKQVRELDKAVEAFRKQHREMDSQMGVELRSN